MCGVELTRQRLSTMAMVRKREPQKKMTLGNKAMAARQSRANHECDEPTVNASSTERRRPVITIPQRCSYGDQAIEMWWPRHREAKHLATFLAVTTY